MIFSFMETFCTFVPSIFSVGGTCTVVVSVSVLLLCDDGLLMYVLYPDRIGFMKNYCGMVDIFLPAKF